MSEVKPREDRTRTGVLLMVLAVAFFTCIDSSAKLLIIAGLPALQVVFARYTGHFLVAVLLFGLRDPSAFRSHAPFKQLLRSLFLLGSTVLNFSALQFLPITVTTTIMFAGPIAITLLAIPLLGEKVGLRRIVAVCCGFAGVLVVMQPWGADFHPAMFLSLGALVCAAFYFILTRMLSDVEANATQQLWSSGVAALCLLPFVLQDWTWPSGWAWVPFVLIGCFGATGHIAATAGHRLADASILAPVVYVQIFMAAFAGWALFDTLPTVWTLGGGAIIIASGLYIWQRERVVRGRVRRPVPAQR
ncbi:EamA family transporter [Sagittula sp. P11]|uniref:DMT family transporter n=1 Tax=Sagittula sp. P11 TaxID=2009329 RepID=UPI000C2CEA0C|nr:DMT family transporter [Sagittula sp. P11]AUC52079.1 EamA family transporter [Sagittula sp. P11]